MRPVEPLDTVPLFPALHAELIALLRGLGPADWERPTGVGTWRVRDIAAHLLDGDIRRLSSQRDGQEPPPSDEPIRGRRDLVRFLNRLNAQWVRVARRFSPELLVQFLELTGPQVAAHFAGLDPDGVAFYPVAWAGDAESPNWFDTGREYTERWHHQQQIREAVGAADLTRPEWLRPVLELSMRALPAAYGEAAAASAAGTGSVVAVEITGPVGDAWSVARRDEGWRLYAGTAADAAARVTLDADAAWRLLFNDLTPEDAARRLRIEGDVALGSVVLAARAVMV